MNRLTQYRIFLFSIFFCFFVFIYVTFPRVRKENASGVFIYSDKTSFLDTKSPEFIFINRTSNSKNVPREAFDNNPRIEPINEVLKHNSTKTTSQTSSKPNNPTKITEPIYVGNPYQNNAKPNPKNENFKPIPTKATSEISSERNNPTEAISLRSNDFRTKYPNCTKEWVESLYKRKWVYELFPDTVVNATPKFVPKPEVEAYVSTICNISHLLSSSYQVWKADGGGPETDPKYENYNAGLLDDPNCVLEMGPSSRPIGDEEFLNSKFLAIYYFAEQTTKALRHLREAISYANFSKRILILPRAGSKTRAATVSMGAYLPLCTYFKITSEVDWVTYEYYYSTSLRLNHFPTVGFKCHRKITEDKCAFDYELEESPLRLIPLLALTRGQYPTRDNTLNYPCFWNNSCFINSTFAATAEEEENFLIEIDLLVLTKTVATYTVYGVPPMDHSLNYSSKVLQRANNISDSLVRYASIHLRLEHLTYYYYSRLVGLESIKSRFMTCVSRLANKVRDYVKSSNSTGLRFYLASDISDFSVQSSSWLPEYVGAGLEAFNYTRQHLSFVMFEDFEPNYEKIDSGIHGMIDKMVCVHSEAFITATYFCGGYQNFDIEIMKLRQLSGKKTNSTIYFDKTEA